VTVSLAVPETFEQVNVSICVPMTAAEMVIIPPAPTVPVHNISELDAEQAAAGVLVQERV